MDLIIYQMVQLQHVHVAHRYVVVEVFTGTSVSQRQLTGLGISAFVQQLNDIALVCTVEYRCRDIPALGLCRQSQVNFQYLSDVHSGRYAQRIQHDLQGLAIILERHILFRQNPGDDTLVTVTSGHLIAHVNLSFCRNVDTYHLVYTRRQLAVSVLSAEYLNVYDDTGFTVRNSQRCISYFFGLLSKNSTEHPDFCGEIGFALRRQLSDQNVGGLHAGTYANDTFFIQFLQHIFADVRDIPGDFFRTQLGLSRFALVFLNMD